MARNTEHNTPNGGDAFPFHQVRLPAIMGACVALLAFTVAILAGLGSDNPTTQILTRALIAMAVCYPVGVVVGAVSDRLIRQDIEDGAEDQRDGKGAGGEPSDSQSTAEKGPDRTSMPSSADAAAG